MAITNFAPTIWSARLTHNLARVSSFINNTNREYEGDAVMGNTVKVFTLNRTSTTVKDYTRNADIDAPQQLDTTSQDVSIDQEKYFNFAVDDLDRVQSRAPLIDQATTDASESMALAIDTFAGSLLDGIADNNWGHRPSSTTAIAATSSHYPLDFTSDVKAVATKLGLPRGNLVCVTTPEVIREFDRQFLQGQYGQNLQGQMAIGQGGTQDPVAGGGSALVSNAFAGTFNGVNFYVSNYSALSTGTGSNTIHKAWVYDPRDFALVVQVNQVEGYRPEKRFADAVKGLVNYGGKILNAGRMQEWRFQGTGLT